MAQFRIQPTSIDPYIARRIAAKARPIPEKIETALTWGADEHLLLGCATAAWIASTVSARRFAPQPDICS